MTAKYTRPDQYYGKLSKAPRDIQDIRKQILPIFAVLLFLELIMATAAVRFWRQQTLMIEDQRTLFRANEIIAGFRQDSLQLGRLLDLAIASPTAENIKTYEALVKKKSAPILNAPPTPDAILNSLSDVTPRNLKLRNASISFGETEWLRFDRVADEFEKLRAIDEKALAILKGDPQAGEEKTGAAPKENPEMVHAILAEQSYEARRIRLTDDFSAMQAALDFRILTLLESDDANGRFFFNTALGGFLLLIPATLLLGLFLNKHEDRLHKSHKTQVRRMNDELSMLRGELAQIQSNPGHPSPTGSPERQ
jgi:hypothetical protein